MVYLVVGLVHIFLKRKLCVAEVHPCLLVLVVIFNLLLLVHIRVDYGLRLQVKGPFRSSQLRIRIESVYLVNRRQLRPMPGLRDVIEIHQPVFFDILRC